MAATWISASYTYLPSLTTSQPTQFSFSSSLQFPLHLRRVRFGNTGQRASSSPLNSRAFPLVAAKQKTFSSFDELLANSDKPVLVDFYAAWCGPCQFMVPILNEVSSILKDTVQVVKVDTEKYPSIADKYRIESLPTFILFKDGQPFDRFEGVFAKEQLIQRIENSLNVKQ